MVFCYLSDSGNFEKSGYVKDLGEFDGFSYSDASGDSEDLLHLVILVNWVISLNLLFLVNMVILLNFKIWLFFQIYEYGIMMTMVD